MFLGPSTMCAAGAPGWFVLASRQACRTARAFMSCLLGPSAVAAVTMFFWTRSVIESCAFTLDSAALYKAAIIPEQQMSWGGLGLKGALNECHLILMKLTGCTLFVFSFLKCPGPD